MRSQEAPAIAQSPAEVGRAFRLRTRPDREADEERLAPAATRSAASWGRVEAEPADPLRTAFERDRDRILHSKAFRRLKHKTQVFLHPEGDHYVTRLTHTLQVTQIARSIAAALGLHEVLTEAIALGHDVGHSPFGHTGEDALGPYFPGGWHHAAQSVRVFEVLEGSNLTWEVRDGIRAHSWSVEPGPATPEGVVVRYADRIAYLSHDCLDAVRAGWLDVADLPAAACAAFGEPGREMINAMIHAVVDHTVAVDEVAMAPGQLEAMQRLREFMFARVYQSEASHRQKAAAVSVIQGLVDYFIANPEELPASYRDPSAEPVRQVVDYVAGMTDRFALNAHRRLVGDAGASELDAPS